MSANTKKWVTLGRVSGVFGVKGWLKVQSYTEPRDNIATFGAWTVAQERRRSARSTWRTVAATRAAAWSRSCAAWTIGICAREWVGAEIVVERERLPAVAADEFYWTDLEGLEVRTTAGEVLGKVDHLLATGCERRARARRFAGAS